MPAALFMLQLGLCSRIVAISTAAFEGGRGLFLDGSNETSTGPPGHDSPLLSEPGIRQHFSPLRQDSYTTPLWK